VKWFGESWGAPVCEAESHAPTPVGEICLQCERAIEADDQGVIIPHIESLSRPTRDRAQHLDCHLHSIGALPCSPPFHPERVTGVAEAVVTSITLMSDPSNRFVQCACGTGFLTSAARKDRAGRPLCIECGAAQELA